MPRTYPLEITVEDLVETTAECVLAEMECALDELRRQHHWDAEHTENVDVHDLLARHQAIALIWDADMVLSHHPHLTRDQAWDVLQQCERDYQAEHGLTWPDIEAAVCKLFPDASEAKQRLLDRLDRLRSQVEVLPAQVCTNPAAYGEAAATLDAIATQMKEIRP